MNLITDTDFLSRQLKDVAIFLKYGTREKRCLFIATALVGFGVWFNSLKLKEFPVLEKIDLKTLEIWQSSIFIGLCVFSAVFVIYVFHRYLSKIALVRQTGETKELASSIKGLMAFTNEDGALFLKLERDKELIELKNHINNSQIPFVVVMGESGAGKTSLLRAGLSYLLQDSETKYIYWEALPRDAVGGLLKAINKGLGLETEISQLNELLTLPKKSVIVLDQFEQLLPDKTEFAPIFDLLKQVIVAAPPHTITWIIAFRAEYTFKWRKFELENKFGVIETIPISFFSIAQGQNVLITLAQEAGLTLEQDLVDSFIKTVQKNDCLSPVDIGIGLLMLQELATKTKNQQLSLADYNFVGGSQGLFVSFLKNKIEQRFPEQYEQDALFKVLSELIDLNRNQRIAEGKTLAEMKLKAEDLPLEYLEYALDYLASVQVRLLEKISRADGLAAYRLQHESMIPALLQLSGNLFGEMREANSILQRAYSTWLYMQKSNHYLLQGEELKQVLNFRLQIDVAGKEDFLELSRKRKYTLTYFYVVFSIFTATFLFLAVTQVLPKFIKQFSINRNFDNINKPDILNLNAEIIKIILHVISENPSSLIIYFFPILLAVILRKNNLRAIFLCNLFLGLSGISWIVVLIWAYFERENSLFKPIAKECEHCKEIVKISATVCPYCHLPTKSLIKAA